jgi:hypothetical protein
LFYSQCDFTAAPLDLHLVSHFVYLDVYLDFTWERGKKYLAFSILGVYKDAPDVQDSPEETRCIELAQVSSA